MTQKFSGKNFTAELSNGIQINIYEMSCDVPSALEGVKGGGFIQTEPDPPMLKIKLEHDQFVELINACPDGGLEELDSFDLVCTGVVGSITSKAEFFGVKLKAPSELSMIKTEADHLMNELEAIVTDRARGYLSINDKRLIGLAGLE